MSIYTILLVAALAVTGSLGDESSPGGGGLGGGLLGGRLQGITEPRLAVNVIRIYQIEKQIERLRERIAEAAKVDPDKFVDEIDARLTTLEDDHCPAKEFQCGDSRSSGQECISDLFVCDGHKDCHNGHDEDEEVCDTTPITAGNTFSGLTHWTSCIVREDHVSTLRIIGTARSKLFPARVGVQAIATSEYEDHGQKVTRTFKLKGGYNFSNRRLALFPSDAEDQSDALGLKCFFNHGDDERAECKILTLTSQTECATTYFTLEQDEE